MRKITAVLALALGFVLFVSAEEKVTVCVNDLRIPESKSQLVNINADKMTDVFLAEFKDSEKAHYVTEREKKKVEKLAEKSKKGVKLTDEEKKEVADFSSNKIEYLLSWDISVNSGKPMLYVQLISAKDAKALFNNLIEPKPGDKADSIVKRAADAAQKSIEEFLAKSKPAK